VKIAPLLQRLGNAALGIFYPPHCANCGADTASGVHLCEKCAKEAYYIKPPFCQDCSEPFAGAIDADFTCFKCENQPRYYERAVTRYLSKGVVREFIHRFKYNHQFYLRIPLAGWLVEAIRDDRIAGLPYDALVPVPLHPARQRERGFNQAEVLAKLAAKSLNTEVWNVLRRIRYTTTQTKLRKEKRTENLRNAFVVRHTDQVQSRHLILVDDVFTTGSTVDECARVLFEAGAASVRVATVARG